MNANDKFFARDAPVDSAAVAPLPNSRKIHVEGSRPDIRVPMREITQSDTPASSVPRAIPRSRLRHVRSLHRSAATIDLRCGLPALRAPWIEERGDTEALDGPTSAYGRARLADPGLAELRFASTGSRGARRRARTSPRCTTRAGAS